MNTRPLIIMGVSGSGKSAVGAGLAERLGYPFVEGDDFHPAANVAKMAAGQPLDNADRHAWIETLCKPVNDAGNCVVACSALNDTVRGWLAESLMNAPTYIWLQAPEPVLAQRLADRTGHFFDPSLLSSQLAALQPPEVALAISADQPVKDVVAEIIRRIAEL